MGNLIQLILLTVVQIIPITRKKTVILTTTTYEYMSHA